MPFSPNISTTQYLPEETREVVQAFASLATDDKLALLYYIYKEMGTSITPAEPKAADPNLAPVVIGNFYDLSDDDQLAAMRDIVNRSDTEYSTMEL